MRAASRFAPALLAAGAILAALPALAPTPARADAVDDAVKAFEDYLNTNPDSNGIRNQVAELGLKKDPRVAKALLPLLTSRKYDDDVKIAVCQCIGKQGDRAVLGRLRAIADIKKIDKEKPKLLAAVLEAVGDADAKGNYKFLIDIAKEQLNYNADIAGAAFRAASNHVTQDSVDDLVKQLAVTDTADQKDSAEKKAARNGTRPVIMDCLKKMTGQDIRDAQGWKSWWDDNKKGWKPPTAGGDAEQDLTKLEVLKDSVYRYEFKKPNKAWHFRKLTGSQHHAVALEAMDEGQKAAFVELTIYSTKNYEPRTPDGYAKAWREGNEAKFRDLKETEWEKKCRYAGVSGVEQILVGQHKDEGAVHIHNVFLEDGGYMYLLVGLYKSGKPASMKDDLEEILRSFKITK